MDFKVYYFNLNGHMPIEGNVTTKKLKKEDMQFLIGNVQTRNCKLILKIVKVVKHFVELVLMCYLMQYLKLSYY